jgi:hypothetical protein
LLANYHDEVRTNWRAELVPGIALMLALLSTFPVSSLAASPSPGAAEGRAPAPSVAPAIVLDSGVVRLAADSITIHAGERTFKITQDLGGPEIAIASDPGDAHYRTLELTWFDQGTEMRLNLYFAADDDSWWVSEIRSYDGLPDGDWISYGGPFFETPLGFGWAGDFDHVGVGRRAPGRLEIRGMRLTGFELETIPADVQNCRPASEAGLDVAQVARMTPAQAHAFLRARGICHSFRYDAAGYSERWCMVPPGRITDIETGTDGILIIFVEDAVPTLHTPRPQPPTGWGC